MSTDQKTVLIAGAGPTGLMAALELRRFAIPVRLIDRLDAPVTTSRAIGIQARTLEEMQLRGLLDQFTQLGHVAHGVSIYGAGRRLTRIDFTRIESRYNYLLFLSQVETERILREALEKQGVEVERGVEMTAFAQTPTGVSTTLRHKDGTLEEAHASYLISAEGAHSVVRASLDLPFAGKTLNNSYALGDLHAHGDLPDSDIHIFSSEHGFLGLFPLGGNHFRLIASNPLSTPDSNTAPSLEELQTIYDQRSPTPAQLSGLVWSSWFHINSRMVNTLKVGRIFLAGDAAHIHSPAGGQGMNTGMQDMMNLGWKLAFVMQGKASEKLLDTYEEDRLPVMRFVLSRTEALTDIVGAENALVRSAFNHIAPLIAGTGLAQEKATSNLSQIALNYRVSPLSLDYGHGGSLHAGDRVPDLPLRVRGDGAEFPDAEIQGCTLFQLLDPRCFTLLVANAGRAGTLRAQASRALESWREVIRVVEVEPEPGREKQFTDQFGSAPLLLLIRPDGYAGYRSGEPSTHRLVKYCRRWLTARAREIAA
jgi:2-polyprenyl-6-methoxyphenol hydroxylase-like FAD-dependent oxidoreductase